MLHTTIETIPCFVTGSGIEVPTVTVEQMIEIDNIATEQTGPNLFQMMENAGRNLAELTLQIFGKKWDKSTIVVLAGSGGNGGGGICAARHLANRDLDVNLCITNPEKMEEVTQFQRKIFQITPGVEVDPDDLEHIYPDLIIDAMIGYHLKFEPRGITADLIQWANDSNAAILALDAPSGLDCTSGKTPGKYIKPEWTMTLALPKTGLLPDKTGDLWLADIGIPGEVYQHAGIKYTAPFGKKFRVALSVDDK